MTRCELIPSDVLDRVHSALDEASQAGKEMIDNGGHAEAWQSFAEMMEAAWQALTDARFLESVEARRVRDALLGFPHASEDRLCLMLAPVDRAVVRRVLALLKESV